MSEYSLGTAKGKIVLESDTSGVEKTEAALNNLTTKHKSGFDTLGKAAGIASLAIAGGFGLAVKSAADFEQGLSNIKAVSGATDAEMKKISEAALRIGKDTSFSASEAASAMEELVKAGIPIEDVLNGAADATVALAAAGGVDLPTAASIASNAMNQFGIKAKDMTGVVDAIAGAANASAIDVGDFGMSLSQVGAVANLVGLSFYDTSVAIAELGNAGIKGSDAGTSLKTMLMNLQPQTKKQIDLMTKLGIVTADGSNKFFTQEGKLKSLRDIQEILNTSLAGMTDAQKQATLETIFGSDAIRAAAVLTKEGAAGYDEMASAMNKVSAADVAKTRLDNFKGSLEALKGSVETVAIKIGMLLIPTLRSLVEGLAKAVDWFGELPEGVQKVIVIVGVAAMAILGFTAIATKMVKVIAKTKTVLAALGATFKAAFVTSPIGWVIAAVIALGVAIYELWKHSEGFRNAMIAAWDGIKSAAQTAWNAIRPILTWFKELWAEVVDAFQNGDWSGLWDKITEGLSNAWNALKGLGSKIGGWIKQAWDYVGQRLPGWVQSAWSWLSTSFWPWLTSTLGDFGAWIGGWVWKGLSYLGSNIPGWIMAAFHWLGTEFWPWLTSSLGDFGKWLGDWVLKGALYVGSNLGSWISEAFKWFFTDFLPWLASGLRDFGEFLAEWLWLGLTYVAANLPGWFASAFSWLFTEFLPWIWSSLGDLGAMLWQWILAGLKVVGGLIAGAAMIVGTWFVDFIKWIFSGIGDLGSAIWNWIWSGIKWVGSKIGSLAGEVGGWLADLADWILSGIGDIGAKIWEKISGAFTWLGDQIKAAWDAIWGAITGGPDDAGSNGMPNGDFNKWESGGDYNPDTGEVPTMQKGGGLKNLSPALAKEYGKASKLTTDYTNKTAQAHNTMWAGVNMATTTGAMAMSTTTQSANTAISTNTQSTWSGLAGSIGAYASQAASSASSSWWMMQSNTASSNAGTLSNSGATWNAISRVISSNSASASASASESSWWLSKSVSGANAQTQNNTSSAWSAMFSIIASGSASGRNVGVANMQDMANSIRALSGVLHVAGVYLMTSLAVGLGGGLGSVVGVMNQARNAIQYGASSVNLYGVGYNIMLGLANGISAAGSIAIGRAQAVAAAINAAVASTARVASPSKVMIYYGKMIALGLAEGMKDRMATAIAVAEGGSADILSALSSGVNAGPQRFVSDPASYGASRTGNPVVPGNAGVVVEQLQINNPTPEPASNSLPVAIRRLSKV